MTNLVDSKARLMIVLRDVLYGFVVILGLARLRIILTLLASPASYQDRDILQEYLMAKALVSGVNPYLPLDKLAEMFIGKFDFLSHPSPYPPFVAILSTPLLAFKLNQVIILWFIIELGCLIGVALMITVLWKGKVDWIRGIFILFLLLCWYPVMVDLLYGQLTILLTTLILGSLLALRKEKKILAGVLVGFSVAIKMFTWPLIIYFAVKKDWRAFISSSLTVIVLNVLALLTLGVGPVSDYYLRVTMQANAIYHAFIKNYSIWSIGYRLFEGTSPIGGVYISAPPLIDLPKIAPTVSAGLAAAFLLAGLFWATRSKDQNISYAIMVSVLIGISPISWDHYYVITIIALAILWSSLSKHAYPNRETIIFLIIALLLFIFNEYISSAMILVNGGSAALQASGNRVSFASSMLEMLPMLELVILAILSWRMGLSSDQREFIAHASQSSPIAKIAHQ